MIIFKKFYDYDSVNYIYLNDIFKKFKNGELIERKKISVFLNLYQKDAKI